MDYRCALQSERSDAFARMDRKQNSGMSRRASLLHQLQRRALRARFYSPTERAFWNKRRHIPAGVSQVAESKHKTWLLHHRVGI